ncbi:hypothetical protein KSS87_019028 [Heliosperma pusillum]|nr:hypothetical protein KSS87_019028 [Heliosperma pusillum]
MFDPFSVIFVAVIQALFFGDRLTAGLLIGMVVMIIGLYCYLWGKRREEQSAAKALPTTSPAASPVAATGPAAQPSLED